MRNCKSFASLDYRGQRDAGRDLAIFLSRNHQVISFSRSDCDVTDPLVVSPTIGKARPDILIHAAALTAVDQCERYPDLAFHVNAGGTRNVALACSKARVPMLYISTGYVFDGEKPAPYVETDPPNPINVYGKSKLEGEKQVSELVDRLWIVRVSWLFGPLGKNFVRTILEQARRGESLRVVDDQMGAPTYTMDVAEMLEKIIERGSPGVYHLTNQGYCSWFDFAREILD